MMNDVLSHFFKNSLYTILKLLTMTQDLLQKDLRHPEMCDVTLQEFSLYVFSMRAIRHFSVFSVLLAYRKTRELGKLLALWVLLPAPASLQMNHKQVPWPP